MPRGLRSKEAAFQKRDGVAMAAGRRRMSPQQIARDRQVAIAQGKCAFTCDGEMVKEGVTQQGVALMSGFMGDFQHVEHIGFQHLSKKQTKAYADYLQKKLDRSAEAVLPE